MSNVDDIKVIANDRRARLISYLMAVANERSKSIRDVKDYEAVFWLSDVPHEDGCFTLAWTPDADEDDDRGWIEIKAAPEPLKPAIPELCREWVTQSPTDPLLRPELLREIVREMPNPDWHEDSDEPATLPQTYTLDDYPQVCEALDIYLDTQWQPWAKQYAVWQKIQKAYADLYAMRQKLKQYGENLELVLALGLITWQMPDGQRICRHAVMANAALEFNAEQGKFTVIPHAEGAKLRLELDMFSAEERPITIEAEELVDLLEQAEDDPWHTEYLDKVLRSLAKSLATEGRYDDTLVGRAAPTGDKPLIEYAPALILRKRSDRSYIHALTEIRRQIEEEDIVLDELAYIVDIPRPDTTPSKQNDAQDKPETVFFPKPSNDEQYRIVQKMRSAGGVLVQGPPGTGKSHTIANLICHLLATGQRTLITAKSSNALKVLESHIPAELRPLCISLLGEGLKEQESLAYSVNRILNKQDRWHEADARAEMASHEAHLHTLRREQSELERRMYDVCEAETHIRDIADGAYQGTAASIAEQVDKQREDYDWFVDAAPWEQSNCPVSSEQAYNCLDGLRHYDADRRDELSRLRPDNILSSKDFTCLVREEAEAKEKYTMLAERSTPQQIMPLTALSEDAIRTLFNALNCFQKELTALRNIAYPWKDTVLRDVLCDHTGIWHEGLRITNQAIEEMTPHIITADNTVVELPAGRDPRAIQADALVLQKHLADGGSLGWLIFQPKEVKSRRYLSESVRLNGQNCTTEADFARLVNILQVHIACDKAWTLWQNHVQRFNGAYALQQTELISLRDSLSKVLALETSLKACRDAFRQHPQLPPPEWNNPQQIIAVISACQAALAQKELEYIQDNIADIEAMLAEMAASGQAHPITEQFRSAVVARDCVAYELCHAALAELKHESEKLNRFELQCQQLQRHLPKLTAALRADCHNGAWATRLGGLAQAWHWQQARTWVEKYVHQEDLSAIEARIKQIEDESRQVVAKLASLHAWSFCFNRMEDHHRSHMTSWQQTMRRLGRGTGKHAAKYRRDARQHLDQCRDGVPAWVMPLDRVWDTVQPAQHIFDVVIVDEASQCDLKALPLFYLGKKILIIGDDRQTSPEAVGINQNAIDRLRDEYLYDFEYKSTFDAQSSLFDHARIHFGRQSVTLLEHFRCMPEIIAFSNELCYAETPLIPLRQYGPNRLPPLENIYVADGFRQGSSGNVTNRPEADAVVDKIVALCADRRYDDKSIGVITLQGNAQAKLIESQLLQRLSAEEFEQRKLICGDAAGFQGDERDVILLSMVAAPNERIGTLSKESDKRRFNVATSRARDQMILVHSVQLHDLSPDCLRAKLLEFFTQSHGGKISGINLVELEHRAVTDKRTVIKPPAPFDSWFEVDVALAIARRQYTVHPQYKVANRRIDLVVEGEQARLAVECDGDYWHGPDRYEQDMHRQRQLERCGWTFFRVRGSAFYADKEASLQPLWQMLEERGIEPNKPKNPLHIAGDD